MLRPRDTGGKSEPDESQTSPAAPTPASPAATSTPSSSPTWQVMRQTREERRPPLTDSGGESVIGPHDFFKGVYKSERAIRVAGHVEGVIESNGHILVEQGAQVAADMKAEDITVAGRYNGKTECRRRFEITQTGIVTGEMNTDLLVVQEGGYFDGRLQMKERSGAGRVSSSGQPSQSSSGTTTRSGTLT